MHCTPYWQHPCELGVIHEQSSLQWYKAFPASWYLGDRCMFLHSSIAFPRHSSNCKHGLYLQSVCELLCSDEARVVGVKRLKRRPQCLFVLYLVQVLNNVPSPKCPKAYPIRWLCFLAAQSRKRLPIRLVVLYWIRDALGLCWKKLALAGG